MKTFTLLFSLCFADSCIAQERLEYANFVQTDTAVKWAAIYSSYVNLTPVNPNFSLLNFYINKLKQNNVAIYKEDSLTFSVTPTQAGYKDFKTSLHRVEFDINKMNWDFNYQEEHSCIECTVPKQSDQCDTCPTNDFFFFKIKQLVYYKNYHLQIKNIYLNPVIYNHYNPVAQDSAKYFETINIAFDNAESDEDIIPSSAKFITRSFNRLNLYPISDHLDERRILTLRNWNLAAVLRQDIKKRKISAYDTQKSIYSKGSKILNPNSLDEFLNPPITVMEYDFPEGQGGSRSRKMKNEINIDSIHNFLIVQDFYFDFAKEKMYSKLIALVALKEIFSPGGIDFGLGRYWGIIFPENKKTGIKNHK